MRYGHWRPGHVWPGPGGIATEASQTVGLVLKMMWAQSGPQPRDHSREPVRRGSAKSAALDDIGHNVVRRLDLGVCAVGAVVATTLKEDFPPRYDQKRD